MSFAAGAPRTSVVSVTPLPHWQARICWQGVPDAEAYFVEGNEPVESLFVRAKTTGAICRAVNLFGAVPGSVNVVTVSAGSEVDGQMTFGERSPQFHFLSAGTYQAAGGDIGDEFLSPPPLCSPADRYPSLEAAESMAPSNVRLSDVTKENDWTPRIRLNVTCPTGEIANVRKYEIYENVMKPDGSTATRMTSRDGCPNNLLLNGAWGDRSTITVAAIYPAKPGDKPVHSVCTAPQTITYGAAIVGTPQLRGNGDVLEGSLSGGKAGEVLLFVNPADAYKLTSPDQTQNGRSFTTRVDLKHGLNRVYAVARRKIGARVAYSEPAEILLRHGTTANPRLTALPRFELTDELYVTGNAAPASPVAVEILQEDKSLFTTTLYSSAAGDFGSDIRLAGLPRGLYRIRATSPGAKQPFTADLHIAEIAPEPAISLDAGPGPFWSAENSATIAGKITPRIENYRLAATVNGKPVAVTPGDDSTFSLQAPLAMGANKIRFQAKSDQTGQESMQVEIVVRFGSREPGDVDLGRVQQLLSNGWDVVESDAQAALAAFTEAIDENPRAASGYTGRAAAYIVLDETKRAFEDASHAVELDPRDYRAWSYRANDLLGEGKNAEAAVSAERSIQLDATWAMPFSNRARAHLDEYDFVAAAADATKALELDEKSAYSYRVRASAFHHLGRNADALEDVTRAIAIEPESTEGLWIRGQVQTALGNYQQALRDYEKLLSIDGDGAASYHVAMAWTKYHKGDLDAALGDIESSLALAESASAYSNRAWIRQAKGDTSGALEDLTKAKSLEPDYYGIRLDDGLAAFLAGNEARAIEVWEEALAADAGDASAIAPLQAIARQRLARKQK